ncbi:sensor histidine kinase [Protaetiibacter sp. SSC-01]|uniref:sensor histidine kinase n=1 Tax=Protaetiibacter sp. SSC-01 TaxID=2759943 RepID=UPI00223B67B3|nr:sensor histidine kinase [Protaetiibacter sp. SSC-01]
METTTRRGYGRYWAGLLPELGFLLPMLPIVITGITLLMTLFWTGVGMIPIFIGVFIVLAALFVARGFGILELWRLRGALFPAITPPRWDRTARGGGALSKLLSPMIDGHYWLYLLHGSLVNPIVGIITWSITIAWLSIALAGIGYPIVALFVPDDNVGLVGLVQYLVDEGAVLPELLINPAFHAVVIVAVGLVFLLTLPFVTHGLTWIHHAIARGMLSAWRSEELRVQMADLSASRSAAVAAEGTALRRLERDIHDGPQQRLVRLQMDLASAERQLEKDPDAARELIALARSQSKEALEELRALSRGFAPPILMDRGLVAALESLAVRSPLPTHVESLLPEGLALQPELERNAYFIAAEALTNVAKHANAQNAWVRLETRAGDDEEPRWLDVVVTDDGAGGASTVAGHGLAGIAERVRGLGGTMDLVSPAGGPTHVIARLPLGNGVPAAR